MAALFTPISTVTLSASTSSARVAVVGDASTIRVYNAGTATAFLKFGSSSVTAAVTDMPVPAGAIETFRTGTLTHVAGITSSGTATLYITSGEGQ